MSPFLILAYLDGLIDTVSNITYPATPASIKINDSHITHLYYEGQPVVTFALIDQIHQRPNGTARRTFTKNRAHFINAEDYLKIPVSEIRTRKIMEISPKASGVVIFLTKIGYLKIVKSFRTSQEITKQVCHKYFGDESVLFLGMQSHENEFGTFLAQTFEGIAIVSSQVKIQDYRVDFLLPEYGIIIEYDEEQHKKNAHVTKDNERDKTLTLLGYTIVRIKKHESYAVAINRILRLLWQKIQA